MTEQETTLRVRSSALTTLALTRHPDVRVRRSALADDTRKDVYLKGDAENRPPRFVVYFHGELVLATPKAAERVAGRVLARVSDDLPSCPTLLAVFSHTDDRGWITWVAKPEGDELVTMTVPDCRPFDRAAMDDIVCVVKAWQPAGVAKGA